MNGVLLGILGAMAPIGSIITAILLIIIAGVVFANVLIPSYLFWADTPFLAILATMAFTFMNVFAMRLIDARSKAGGKSDDWSVYVYYGIVFITTVLPLLFLWTTGLSLFFYTEFFNLIIGILIFSSVLFSVNFLRPFLVGKSDQ